ncbi:MAG TPA: purine-nucleoside phosphorylase [Thermoanaerobaculia bacterium]|nr:purine-nucleoside phosphorylase [Thermoanaerobaculia bacterium]
MLEKLNEALKYLQSRSKLAPTVGVILGSGLGNVVDAVDAEVVIPFSDIPDAPVSSVAGHSGKLILGKVGVIDVAIMQGRVHYYEGYSMEQVLFLPRLLGRLGVRTAIVTNAAGGVNTAYRPGDLMLISDHINFFGVNPLRGKNIDELGPRFPDMSFAYPVELRDFARSAATDEGVELREGVYLGLSGPTYETPAEIRMFRTLGADAVGMSTVPDVIALAHMGIPALGISCITNMAAGILPQKLTHQEVMDTTARVQKQFTALVLGAISRMG